MMDVLIAFLLDETGSMHSQKSDVIGGFNSFLEEQRKVEGKCRFIFTRFNSAKIDTEDYTDIAEVPELTDGTYLPNHSTPLFDAIGKTVADIDDLEILVDRVLFVIFTDGEENSSREYRKADIARIVKEHEAKQSWDFLFIGADIDAYDEAAKVGLAAGSTITTNSMSVGSTFGATGQSVTAYREGDSDWQASLREEETRQKEGSKS